MRRLALVSIVALAASCTLEPGRGELQAEVIAVPAAGTTWVDDDGRTFELTTGSMTLRDLQFVEPNTQTAQTSRSAPSSRSVVALRLLPLLGASSAWAHPGHDDAGPVGGELLGAFPVDLTQAEVALGQASMYEGDYVGAELAYEGEVVFEGTVDGTPFAFTVTPSQALTAIDFDASFAASDAPTLELRVDAAWALSFVDWGAGDADGDGVVTESDGDQASLLLFGLHSNEGYEVVVR